MRSFRTRILALVLGMVIVVLAATVIAVVMNARAAVERAAGAQLRAAAATAHEVLKFRGNELTQAAEALTGDFGFKEAVATADTPTLASALAGARTRIGVDLLVALDPTGHAVATAGASLSPGARADLEALVAQDVDGRPLRLYHLVDGRPYQLVIAPVLAPDPVGWTAVGFALDDRAAVDMARLLGVEVSFVTGPRGAARVAASSLGVEARAQLGEVGSQAGATPFLLKTPRDEFLTWADPVRSANAPLSLVLQRSLAGAMQPFRQLRDSIAVVGLTILGLGSALAVLLARSATQPLAELTRAAERLEAGDYAARLPAATTTELARLASAFNAMRSAVADREQRIRHQALHDPLTGLPTRAAITATLDALCREAERAQPALLVCLIELEQLDDIVASLGHAAGDELLRELARRLAATVDGAERVARIGTDRFLALLEGVGAEAAPRRARALAESLRAPFDHGAVCLQVDLKLGVAVFPDDGSSAAGLLQRAELALFRGRQTGAPVETYRRGDDETQRQRLAILGDLRRAVEAGALELAYQPKVRLADERVTGCEALLRWHHAGHGLVPPSQFIPYAERTGLIRPLTAWVVREALRQARLWQNEGRALDVAINISPANLADPDFVDSVEGALLETRADASHILFEVTEGAAMRDLARTLKVMERLRILGLRFSIDDFGTGYSSLTQLRRLAVDELKIDRSFVLDLETGGDDDLIVRSTIELAHGLGLKVVAEGVERSTSLQILRRLGCDLVQGYFYSKPLPAHAFTEWLRGRAGYAGPPRAILALPASRAL